MSKPTVPTEPLSRAALASLYALTALALLGGWWIVCNQGFTSQLGRRGGPHVLVEPPMAWVMATLEFALAAIGVLALARAHGLRPATQWRLVALVVLPPLVKLTSGLSSAL